MFVNGFVGIARQRAHADHGAWIVKTAAHKVFFSVEHIDDVSGLGIGLLGNGSAKNPRVTIAYGVFAIFAQDKGWVVQTEGSILKVRAVAVLRSEIEASLVPAC